MHRTLIGATAAIMAAAAALTGSAEAQLDVSAGAGGVGIDASAGVSSSGISAGASVATGGSSFEASVSSGGGSLGASVSGGGGSVGGSVGGGGGGTSGGGEGSGAASSGGPGSEGGRVGASRAIGFSRSTGDSDRSPLPSSLIPRLSCDSSYEPGCQSVPDVQSARFRRALAQLGNAPRAVVAACRNGIIRGAAPYDPVRVDAVSIGGVRPVSGGGQLAPLFVRIVYDRQGGYETREAEISCQLDAGGTVVALS